MSQSSDGVNVEVIASPSLSALTSSATHGPSLAFKREAAQFTNTFSSSPALAPIPLDNDITFRPGTESKRLLADAEDAKSIAPVVAAAVAKMSMDHSHITTHDSVLDTSLSLVTTGELPAVDEIKAMNASLTADHVANELAGATTKIDSGCELSSISSAPSLASPLRLAMTTRATSLESSLATVTSGNVALEAPAAARSASSVASTESLTSGGASAHGRYVVHRAMIEQIDQLDQELREVTSRHDRLLVASQGFSVQLDQSRAARRELEATIAKINDERASDARAAASRIAALTADVATLTRQVAVLQRTSDATITDAVAADRSRMLSILQTLANTLPR